MLEFIVNNTATIIISAVILGVVIGIIIKLRKDKKNNICSCGSCNSCPGSGICHKKQQNSI